MRFGAVFPQAEFGRCDPEAVLHYVREVEAAGFDHLLAFDHVLGANAAARESWDGAYDHQDPFLEPVVLFAWLARECNLEFVTDVMVLPQRQTALVAKQLATLELLAPGRTRLGVGIGWNAVEYDALGIDFASRAARLEEQVSLLRRLWTEPSLDHHGATERVEAAGIAPLPPQPLPVWTWGIGSQPSAPTRAPPVASGDLPTAGSRCPRSNPAAASRTPGTTCMGPRGKPAATRPPSDWKVTSGWAPTTSTGYADASTAGTPWAPRPSP